MKAAKLPKTDSIQEFAEFWDSHDLTDFEDELEEVTEPVFVREKPIKLHLKPEEAAAVQKLALAKGVSREDLIRSWVVQQIADGFSGS